MIVALTDYKKYSEKGVGFSEKYESKVSMSFDPKAERYRNAKMKTSRVNFLEYEVSDSKKSIRVPIYHNIWKYSWN